MRFFVAASLAVGMVSAAFYTKNSGTCCGGSRYRWGVAGQGRWDCDAEPTKDECMAYAVSVDGPGPVVQELNGDSITGVCFKQSDGVWKYNTANTPQVCTASNTCYCIADPTPAPTEPPTPRPPTPTPRPTISAETLCSGWKAQYDGDWCGQLRGAERARCPECSADPTPPPTDAPRTPTPGPPAYTTKNSGTCCGGSRYQWGVEGRGRWDCYLEPDNPARCAELAVKVDGAGTTVQEVNGDSVTGVCFRQSDGVWKHNTANTPQVCTASNTCYCLGTPDPAFAGDGSCGNFEDYQITCLEVSGSGKSGKNLKKHCIGNGCKYKNKNGGTCTHNRQSKAKVKCGKITNANLCSCMGCTPKTRGKKKRFKCSGDGSNRKMWPQ